MKEYMLDTRFLFKTHYGKSYALVIGINRYESVSPLSYACNDATEVRDLLVNELGFDSENVFCLLDEGATKSEILKTYARFVRDDIEPDDRLLVFFAGHGHTLSGNRGEVGFLVPYDAKINDMSTFVRWDELTRNAEMIRAKHVLFIMDACYGGLALTRHVLPGSTRFLKDMLLRQSRQVLTAGKANQTVSDAGGPLPGHSVFTGHFIQALRGGAASEGGVITASGVMAYVYSRVSNDKDSNQTPHYGHLDGDGDFIFQAPGLSAFESVERTDLDRLVMIPYPVEDLSSDELSNKTKQVKQLLSNDASSIQLHDFLVSETRRFLASTSTEAFPLGKQFEQDELIERLRRYEESALELSVLLAGVAYWAKPNHLTTLQKCIARSCDQMGQSNGVQIWLGLRWYPLILQLYHVGIAAVDAQRYDSLYALFNTPVSASDYSHDNSTLVETLSKNIADYDIIQIWKRIPGHERHYTPMSEYLFKIVQPNLDDLIFVGKSYESAFDTFEILFALSVADVNMVRDRSVWGPVGRFGWKRRTYSPFDKLVQQAKESGAAWPPIKAGLFGGSYERFERVADEFGKQLARLPWF